MLKKILVCLSLILLIMLLSSSKNKPELVYKEVNSNINEYKQIYLLFENNILNTSTFEQYLKNFHVLKIYPYINPIYINKFEQNYGYIFNHKSHTYDLGEFKQEYIKSLKKYGLINEANFYQANNIIIEKVLIQTTFQNMKMFLKDVPNVKYSLDINGIYKKINYS